MFFLFFFVFYFFFFFFNDTATTEIYTLSLHDALPISPSSTSPRPSYGETTARKRSSSRSPSSAGRFPPTTEPPFGWPRVPARGLSDELSTSYWPAGRR